MACYSSLRRFWPVEDVAEVADGPTGCDEVARGGCSYTWNWSPVLAVAG